jgi:nucleoside-diphosphate-sugar epimerase
MSERDLHVVFGAGQVGSFLAEELRAAGFRVRVVKRHREGVPAGAEVMLGDAADAAFCRQAVRDAAVVYHCMNPEYDTRIWAQFLPRYLENLIAAAGAEDARLVVMENLYMVGRAGGRPIDEDTPPRPESRKGEIRARLGEQLFEAHARGDVRAVSARASDYYGPRGTETHFGGAFWRPVFRGRSANFIPNPDTPHSYHYIPDVAQALRLLGTAGDDVLGRPWMAPCAPAESTRTLVARFERMLGRPIPLRGMPRPLVGVLGWFWPVLGELAEMLHQWDQPFVVDDRRFRARFGVDATDPEDAARETVAWARTAFEEEHARAR